jgi:hypothetical protein
MAEDPKPLTEREIHLIEEIGCLKRHCEISHVVFLALAVRMGGDVTIDSSEMDYTQKNYELTTEMSVSDLTKAIRLKARLK